MTSTTAATVAFARRRIIIPNTAITAAAQAAAAADAEVAAAAAAAVAVAAAAAANEALEEDTAKGRRTRAREKLYSKSSEVGTSAGSGSSRGAGAGKGGGGGGRGPKPALSWLTKHVNNLGWGEEEHMGGSSGGGGGGGGSGHGGGGGGSKADEDEVAAAAAVTLAGGSLGMMKIRTEADDAADAAHRKAASARLAVAETRKGVDPKWVDMQAKRQALPAYAMRAEVLECIEQGRAAVVSGATGCGKTTQVPQFVFESAVRAGAGGECSIIITQPRRLSAIAVAERVAAERCERIGDTVGYAIRLESKQSASTRLLFCTTGILLRRLQVKP